MSLSVIVSRFSKRELASAVVIWLGPQAPASEGGYRRDPLESDEVVAMSFDAWRSRSPDTSVAEIER